MPRAVVKKVEGKATKAVKLKAKAEEIEEPTDEPTGDAKIPAVAEGIVDEGPGADEEDDEEGGGQVEEFSDEEPQEEVSDELKQWILDNWETFPPENYENLWLIVKDYLMGIITPGMNNFYQVAERCGAITRTEEGIIYNTNNELILDNVHKLAKRRGPTFQDVRSDNWLIKCGYKFDRQIGPSNVRKTEVLLSMFVCFRLLQLKRRSSKKKSK